MFKKKTSGFFKLEIQVIPYHRRRVFTYVYLHLKSKYTHNHSVNLQMITNVLTCQHRQSVK